MEVQRLGKKKRCTCQRVTMFQKAYSLMLCTGLFKPSRDGQLQKDASPIYVTDSRQDSLSNEIFTNDTKFDISHFYWNGLIFLPFENIFQHHFYKEGQQNRCVCPFMSMLLYLTLFNQTKLEIFCLFRIVYLFIRKEHDMIMIQTHDINIYW